MADNEVFTEMFLVQAKDEAEAQAEAQKILDTKDLKQGEYRTEIDPVKEFTVRLYQTVAQPEEK